LKEENKMVAGVQANQQVKGAQDSATLQNAATTAASIAETAAVKDEAIKTAAAQTQAQDTKQNFKVV
jgi:hypothetical protein